MLTPRTALAALLVGILSGLVPVPGSLRRAAWAAGPANGKETAGPQAAADQVAARAAADVQANGPQAVEGEPGPDEGDEGDETVPLAAAEAPPPEALPPTQPLDLAAAEQRLSPYGRWVDTPEYGRVWIPHEARGDWQPYASGRWVYTDFGWSFISGAPWGPIGYHYGRWGWGEDLGWYWVPGLVWGPAWVSWRVWNGYVCWSPYPPTGWHHHPGRRWPGWVAVHGEYLRAPIGPHRLARPGSIVRQARALPSPPAAPQRGFHTGPSRSAGTSAWGTAPERRGHFGGLQPGRGGVRSVPGPARGQSGGPARSQGSRPSGGHGGSRGHQR